MNGESKAFICVYKHPSPSSREWRLTCEAATRDPLLQRFLDDYHQPQCIFDWGDDPSFFSARHRLGDERAATWGVCRPDVRRQLHAGDFIVWFCAKADRASTQRLTYAFVGCTTVLEPISRFALWAEKRHAKYRAFYNVLARMEKGSLRQWETFYEFHDDWNDRVRAPYVLFDPDPALSVVNLDAALTVADRAPAAALEVWRSASDPHVAELERLLFTQLGIRRRLRTTNPRVPHRQIALHNELAAIGASAEQLGLLRRQLIDFERTRSGRPRALSRRR